jgi:hypothetical protein
MHSQHTGFEAPTETVSQRTWLEEKRQCLAVERQELESKVGKERGNRLPSSRRHQLFTSRLVWDKHGRPCMSTRRYRMEGKWLEAMRVRSLATTSRHIRVEKGVNSIRYVDRITSRAK